MTRNPAGLRHGTGNNLAFFDLPFAYRRAAHKALLTGVRQRLSLCQVPAADHFLPVLYGDRHYVIEPVDQPHRLDGGVLECTRDPRDHAPGHGCIYAASAGAMDSEPRSED